MSAATLAGERPQRPARVGVGPCTLVLFGATGDLAQRKLFPALYNLAHDGLLPRGFSLIGSARTPLGPEQFHRLIAESIRRNSRRTPEQRTLTELLGRSQFLAGYSDDPGLHSTLAERVQAIEHASGERAARIFYLSTAPELFSPIVERLADLARPPQSAASRILIEKPFGRSATEARDFNASLLSVFSESQVLRVDHYLGKEEVQNILALRFANSIFAPFWNASGVASVQITAAEVVGVGSRASYYEGAGALRDHVQNHMLQLLCMIAMEPPADLGAAALRDEKVAVLEAVAPPRAGAVVRAQYGPGEIDGELVPGYREEEGVDPASQTETYLALRLSVRRPRWAGVPFYLRTGKRLARKETEVALRLRPSPHPAFAASSPLSELRIGLQGDGAVSLTLAQKQPGEGMRIGPVEMAATAPARGAEAYERLLLDALRGESSLFARGDEIEAQWRICDPLLRAFAEQRRPLLAYPAGSQGPAAAQAILAAGDAWRTI
ncbi:MAG TPA: glucose-6-phosphate dehydrogenase [Solirubrobacterales bacterium]|nr:glucose-6-phosphate dehydrogenase [Solirubrobacterales bacterium]